LLVHPELEPEALGLDLSQFQLKRVDAPVLRDIVMIDCPDPDTSEGPSAGSNLAILREIVPHCDVLIYTSTQQKYKNARVIDELADVTLMLGQLTWMFGAEQVEKAVQKKLQKLNKLLETPDQQMEENKHGN